jgi:ribonuclease BN (tRNA processing enzyme)
MGGATIAYLSDHQMPLDGSHGISESALELCDGADVLIHDAQYTVEEFPAKANWGHCTVDYAVHVAKEAGVGRLVLFHHDPTHDDDTVDQMVADARELPEAAGLAEVIAAQEGLVISFP